MSGRPHQAIHTLREEDDRDVGDGERQIDGVEESADPGSADLRQGRQRADGDHERQDGLRSQAPGAHTAVNNCANSVNALENELAAAQAAQHTAEVEMWTAFSSGSLMQDVTYGQSGLVVYAPERALTETSQRREFDLRMNDTDLVVGEFLGDADLLVVQIGEIGALVSRGSTDRQDWARFDDLKCLFRAFLYCLGEKIWDYPGWNESDWQSWPEDRTLYDLHLGFQ